MPARKSPVRKNADKERIAELEKQLNEQQRKSKKLINSISEFQEDVGLTVVPYQRMMLYITTIILFAVGLGMIIYAATHKDMSEVETTRSNMYIVGGILVAAAVIGFFLGRWWLKSVESNPNLRKLNAVLFETEMIKGALR
jgi:hypothetical protein